MTRMSSSRGRSKQIDEEDVFLEIKKQEDKVVKATELAQALGVSSPTVRKRLHRLREDGIVQSKKFGSGEAWWIVQELSEIS